MTEQDDIIYYVTNHHKLRLSNLSEKQLNRYQTEMETVGVKLHSVHKKWRFQLQSSISQVLWYWPDVSSDFTLAHVETQSWAVVSGLPSHLAVMPPPSLLCSDTNELIFMSRGGVTTRWLQSRRPVFNPVFHLSAWNCWIFIMRCRDI